MAEWSALPTCGSPSSIPAEVETFFGGIKSLEHYIAPYTACRFELNFSLKLN